MRRTLLVGFALAITTACSAPGQQEVSDEGTSSRATAERTILSIDSQATSEATGARGNPVAMPNLSEPYTPGMAHGVFDTNKFPVRVEMEDPSRRRVPPTEYRRNAGPRYSIQGGYSDNVKFGSRLLDWPDNSQTYTAQGAYAHHYIVDSRTHNWPTNGDLYAPTLLAPKGTMEVMTCYTNSGPDIRFYNWSTSAASWASAKFGTGTVPNHGFGIIAYTTEFKNNYTYLDGYGQRSYWVTVSRDAGNSLWGFYIWKVSGQWDLVAYVGGNSNIGHNQGWDMYEHNNVETCDSGHIWADDIKVYGKNPNTGNIAWAYANVSETVNPWVPGCANNMDSYNGNGTCYQSHTRYHGSWTWWDMY